ncbi:UDP-galactopyranose mutase [Streptococcus suis]|uniref:UDP-galactopyranose mutase n=1 Tax=Streptococcus suis TaxID=1307 RepID=A0AB33UFF8_STRSU|nr:UDP-galactopyranose mutase [Streptococcus suis]
MNSLITNLVNWSYRSLRFETEVLDMENYQGNAVVNYTDSETPYTRIIEHKHFEYR